jgi:hypothetical protein
VRSHESRLGEFCSRRIGMLVEPKTKFEATRIEFVDVLIQNRRGNRGEEPAPILKFIDAVHHGYLPASLTPR